MINKISSMLRRKFQLCKISVDKQYMKMEFKLTNFINFNKENFSIKNETQDIPFNYVKFSKNNFSIKINLQDIPDENVTFNFHYKKQMLWLVADENISNILELNEKIYIVKVNKSLNLTKYKTNFNFINTTKEVGISQYNDEYISFNTDIIIESLILLNEKQQIEIPILNNQLKLSSISQIIKKQNYTAYIVLNKSIYYPSIHSRSKHKLFSYEI
ncbi:hypothetical protein ACVENB_00015 [Staphylococcus aureus]